MILHPPHAFAENSIQSTLPATPSGNPGTSITASASTNTKGSWTSLIDPLNFDVYRLWLGLSDTNTSATIERVLLDIGYGPTGGGSEQVIISNLLAGGLQNTGSNLGPSRIIDLPIYIPSGTALRARCQSNIGSNTVRVWAVVWGGPDAPPWKVFTMCDDYGTNTSTSAGTSHTAGNTGAESAWASLGSTLSRDYEAFFGLVQNAQTVTTQITYHYELGYSSTTLYEGYASATTTECMHGLWPVGPNYAPLPSGTQMQVRGEASGTAQAHELALYCLY